MALKMIVDADMVRERMSLGDIDGINQALDSALVAAHLHYEGLLQTTFAQQVGVENVFYTDSDWFPAPVNGFLRLRLSNGFVDPSSVVLAVGDSSSAISESVASTSYSVDPVKGVVYLSDEYENKFVKVTFTSGFSATIKPPDWLKEAILSFVPSILNNQQTTNRADEAKTTSDQARNLTERTVEAHLRSTPFCFRPVFNA